MPADTRELEEIFLVTRAELENRIGALEADVRTEPMRVNNTLQEAIDNLKIELDTFKAAWIADFNPENGGRLYSSRQTSNSTRGRA